MAKIAILGFGTVGSGILEILQQNAELIQQRTKQTIQVKYILVRTKRPHPSEHLFTQSIEIILQDPEITMIAEAIGGTGDAYRYVKAALETGRSVVTSNKELVAEHGAELLALAAQHNCAFLFEASVGGGTPIIAPMHESLAANRIEKIQGIINGTTNFMLTKMQQQNMGFDEALRMAQQLGYAETHDPSDDVDGLDACRKLAILASLASGVHVYPKQIPTKGIRDISATDMQAAYKRNSVIKLVAWAKQQNGRLTAGVEPMLVPNEHQLAQVNDVYNAVLVQGNMTGDVMFYGRGAGKLATASAMVADLIQVIRQGNALHDSLFWQPAQQNGELLTEEKPAAYYIRTTNIPASMLPVLYGSGELVLDDGETVCYLAENTNAEKRQRAATKAKALGGRVMLELRCIDE